MTTRPPTVWGATMLAMGIGLLFPRPVAAAAATSPQDLALASHGVTYTGPENHSGAKHRPPVVNDGSIKTGYAWAHLKTPLVMTFPEPVEANKVEVVFFGGHKGWYRFVVEASSDGKTWQKLGDKQEGKPSGHQVVTFPGRKLRLLRLRVTETNVEMGSYHIEEVAVYHQADPSKPTPLAKHIAGGDPLVTTPADRNHDVLLKLIGKGAVVREALRKKLVAGKPGARVTEDLDGDGDADIATFVDPAPRHSDSRRPMLVRVIDDDDDMSADGAGDRDSDCYVADWNADGLIDRVVDYWDLDGDGDADRMDLISRRGLWFRDRIGLTVVEDIGDDDRMWHTRDYEYSQRTTQWKTDFNGDECFTMFAYDMQRGRFVPFFEDPFCHYDIDDDGLVEVVIRGNGDHGYVLKTLRYSYDMDNDNDWLHRRDYDFSFNGRGPVTIPAEACRPIPLRDGSETEPALPWDKTRETVEALPWKQCSLCWDEIDNNVNVLDKDERWHERWEGVGGYAMREGNKRWEHDADHSGKMSLYLSKVDRRIHLKGAEKGEIKVDYDFDNKSDAVFGYADTDDDGLIDTWTYDADADGKPERTYKAEPHAVDIEPPIEKRTTLYRYALIDALDQNQRLIDAIKLALGRTARSPAEEWFIRKRPESFYNPEKLPRSLETLRYYQDVIREELWTITLDAMQAGRLELDRKTLEDAYAKGQFGKVAGLICKGIGKPEPSTFPWFRPKDARLTRRLGLLIQNPVEQERPSVPVVLPIKDVEQWAKDFNPKCFAVADSARRVLIREYPSQADDLDADGKVDEICFTLPKLGRRRSRAVYLYYAPEGERTPAYRKQTNARDPIGQSVGWESELIGFRSYFGKVDFFGKKVECLRLDDLGPDYHKEADWGMDCLHVGSSPGLGGLSLWSQGQVHRLYNEQDKPPRCRIAQRVVANGPVRSAIRLDITDAKIDGETYKASVVASCYAGQMVSEHRVVVTPPATGKDDAVVLSVGMVKIPDAKPAFDPNVAVLTAWGQQDPAIGEIGLALILPPNQAKGLKTVDDSHEIKLALPDDGRTRFFVSAEWIKAQADQRRVVSRTAPTWRKEVRRLAERALHPPTCRIMGMAKLEDHKDSLAEASPENR